MKNLSKTYKGGVQALSDVNLEIKKGEIFALLGPNGAGKTTLISIICGILDASAGEVSVDGHDNVKKYRLTRSLVGLVPQELTTDAFETVWHTVNFSRGLFGKKKDHAHVERVLKALSLWNKKDNKLITLSGGMKRRVMIAKALSHEPRVLFLDEPTAGVDVELRKDMWDHVRRLRESGVTVILTTHYIDEAEEMADRIGVINNGKLILTEEKTKLMKQLGTKQLILDLCEPLGEIPQKLSSYHLEKNAEGTQLFYTYDSNREDTRISELINDLEEINVRFKDLKTVQSSLEDIFVRLVRKS